MNTRETKESFAKAVKPRRIVGKCAMSKNVKMDEYKRTGDSKTFFLLHPFYYFSIMFNQML